MRRSKRIFASVSWMDIVIGYQPVFPGLVIRIGCRGKGAPADSLARLGDDLLIVHFVQSFHLDHVFSGCHLNEKVRVVLLSGFPEKTELIQWRLDPADHVWIFLKDDRELSLRIAVEGVCRIIGLLISGEQVLLDVAPVSERLVVNAPVRFSSRSSRTCGRR